MRSNRRASTLLALLLLACGAAPVGPASPEVLYEEGPSGAVGSKLLVVWEADADEALRAGPLPEEGPLPAFQAELRAFLGPEPAQTALLSAKAARAQGSGDGHNAGVAAALAATHIRPIERFEALLLERQMRRLDMVAHPSEFLAVVLRSKDGRRLRVFQYTVNQAGIGGVGRVRPAVEAALATGAWELWLMLHNHNVFFRGDGPPRRVVTAGRGNGPPGEKGGLVCPSDHDVRLFRAWRDELGLREAWITNGLETGHWPADTFDRFKAAE